MTTRDRLALAAALAVALATASLRPVYDDLGWLLRVLGAVVVVVGASTLARNGGAARAAQPLAGLVALLAYVALVFAGSTLAYGLLPTPSTVSSLLTLVRGGLEDVQLLAPPVPTTPRLVLLAVLGTGAIALAVDLLAVVLRKAALSGLPLLLLFAVPSAVLRGGLGAFAFVLGAAGWLALLLADSGDRATRWGTPLRTARAPELDPSLGRVGRRIGAAALGVAVVVPVLVPGLDGRLLDGGGGGEGGDGSRTTVTYNPLTQLAGQLNQPDPEPLFTYRSPQGPDYLRLTTLDVFDRDDGWSSSELSADVRDDAVQDTLPVPTGRSAATEAVQVDVELTGRLGGPWLPVPATPTVIDIEDAWLWDREAETVFSTRTSVRDVDEPYTVRAARLRPDVALLRRSQSVPPVISDPYAAPAALSGVARRLLDRTVAGATTDFDKVAALQRLFRGPDFTYSVETAAPPAGAQDALTAFLLTKQGFCEQYASAMAALVRGLGIPARVAVGFTAGTRTGDGVYEVTSNDAHAWPEVWFRGAGWVRFEPTPRADQEVDVPDYSVAVPQTDTGADESAPGATTPGTAPGAGGPNPGAADRGLEDGLDGAAGGTADGGWSPWLLTVPGALLLAALPSTVAAVRRRRRWRSPDAELAWSTVRDDAVDVGHQWRPADSPRAAATHLTQARHLPPDAVEGLHRLAVAAERARYARHTGPVDAAALERDTTSLRSALQAGATPRQRWTARLAPPSTLQWAAHALGTAVADVLDRFDLLVSAVGARLRHPRSRSVRRAG